MNEGRVLNALIRASVALRAGNPYHDADGKFTSGPGGAGKHAARRKRRRDQLRRIKRKAKRRIRELRERHHEEHANHRFESDAERVQLGRNHKDEIKQQAKEQARERKTLGKEQAKERQDAETDHARNERFYREADRELARDPRLEEAKAARDRYAAWIAGKREEHAELIREMSEGHQAAQKDLAESHAYDREEMVKDHAQAIKDHERDVAKDKAALDRKHARQIKAEHDRFRREAQDFATEHKVKLKGLEARSFAGHERRVFAAHRTEKASSAESILAACLNARGWMGRFRRGLLSQDQHRRLLRAIRAYGRAWLRHEASEFLRHHQPDETGQVRGIKWVPDPRPDEFGQAGYLFAQETGFVAGLKRFFGRVRQFVREVILAGTMSLAGPGPLGAEDLAAAEREAVHQEQFLDRFQSEVLDGAPTMTPPQFIARAEKYADSAWQAPQRINRAAAIRNPAYKVERRRLGHPKTQHCDDCPPLAEKGWQPIGSLPPIGETECGPLCLCWFEFSDRVGGQGYVQGSKGPLPAPAEPVMMIPDTDDVVMVAEPPGVSLLVPIAGPPR